MADEGPPTLPTSSGEAASTSAPEAQPAAAPADATEDDASDAASSFVVPSGASEVAQAASSYARECAELVLVVAHALMREGARQGLDADEQRHFTDFFVGTTRMARAAAAACADAAEALCRIEPIVTRADVPADDEAGRESNDAPDVSAAHRANAHRRLHAAINAMYASAAAFARVLGRVQRADETHGIDVTTDAWEEPLHASLLYLLALRHHATRLEALADGEPVPRARLVSTR
jgi:hypothetical protein